MLFRIVLFLFAFRILRLLLGAYKFKMQTSWCIESCNVMRSTPLLLALLSVSKSLLFDVTTATSAFDYHFPSLCF